MSGGDHAGTPCPSCGAKYRWKPELAARKIHCAKCGDTIRMPAEAGGAATLVRKADAAAAKSAPKTPAAPAGAPASDEELPTLTEETAPPASDAAPDPLLGTDALATPANDDLSLSGAADADANIYDLAGTDDLALAPQPAAAPAPEAAPPVAAPLPKKAGKAAKAQADEAPACPSCRNPVKPGAVICLNCGFNIAAGSKIKTEVAADDAQEQPARAKRKRAPVDADAARAKFINLQLPLALIGLGFLLQIGTAYLGAQKGSALSAMLGHGMVPMTIAAIQVAAGIVFMIPFLFIMIAALKILQIEYGPLHQGLLKAAAIGWGPGAITSIVVTLIGGGFAGFALGFLTLVITYFGLIMVLFSISLGKAILLFLLNLALVIVAAMCLGGLLMLILRMFIH